MIDHKRRSVGYLAGSNKDFDPTIKKLPLKLQVQKQSQDVSRSFNSPMDVKNPGKSSKKELKIAPKSTKAVDRYHFTNPMHFN
jgi:hypothetical protein